MPSRERVRRPLERRAQRAQHGFDPHVLRGAVPVVVDLERHREALAGGHASAVRAPSGALLPPDTLRFIAGELQHIDAARNAEMARIGQYDIFSDLSAPPLPALSS